MTKPANNMSNTKVGKDLRAKIFLFHIEFCERWGRSPTIREIGEAVGRSSSATIHGHLQKLINQGLIVHHSRVNAEILEWIRASGGGWAILEREFEKRKAKK